MDEFKPVTERPLYDGILAAGDACSDPCVSDSDNSNGGVVYDEVLEKD